MCGICGFIDFKFNSDVDVLYNMTSTLHHRGPNDKGLEVEQFEFARVGFGHTRLSILDLSTAGRQPMNYKNLLIVFNGEIYNYKEIGEELINLGHNFISESDTEILLHAFDEWGISSIDKFIGMFAFAILNKDNNKIYLVRDRAGVKPLYYYWNDGLFLFASELKSITKHPRFKKKIDIYSFHQYMDLGYIPAPNCIFKNSYKLSPGHYIVFDIDNNNYEIFKYWDVKDYYRLPKLDIGYKVAKEKVNELLHSAYEYRMVSDVPVGVFLSGGYDSTSVAAILQSSRTNSKIKTFTIGFQDGNNEAPFAKAIAEYLGTDHSEYFCSTKEAQDIIPQLPLIYDEPFSDSSAIPTIMVSKLARESVMVALSADGGDEIFAGYSIYNDFLKRMALIEKIPVELRKITGSIANLTSKALLKAHPTSSRKLSIIDAILSKKNGCSPLQVYKHFFLLNKVFKNTLFSSLPKDLISEFDSDYSDFSDVLSIVQAVDFKMYMSDDILTKVDRATMSVSLEGREPLLDHRIIEFVAQLPSNYKFGFSQKMILKDIVHDFVPKNLMDRPKAGFSIPLVNWLSTDLNYLVHENLNEKQLSKSGLLNTKEVLILVSDFNSGNLANTDILWKLIQFQIWYSMWMD